MEFIFGRNTSLYESPECEVITVSLDRGILSGSIEDWGEEDLFGNG